MQTRLSEQTSSPLTPHPSPLTNSPLTSHQPRYSFRISRTGWYWLLAPAILWFIGLYKGINLLTLVASVMVAIWVFNLVVARRVVRGLRVRRRVDGPIFAETPFTLDLELNNGRRVPRFGVRLEDRGADHSLVKFVPRLGPGEKVRFRHELTLPRRGRYAWEDVRVRTGYPFGLAEGGVEETSAQEAIVFPRLGRLHRGRLRQFLVQAAPPREMVRRRLCRHPAAQSEFHGLRQFRPGDSPRLIHWRTSARRNELMIREFEETPTDNLVLVVEPWAPWELAGAEAQGPVVPEKLSISSRRAAATLEDALSLAATICWDWCRQQGDRLVLAVAGQEAVVFDGLTGRPFALQLLRCLALLSGTPEPSTGPLVERLTSTELPRASILVVSTRPARFADVLAVRLHRPVAGLDVSARPSYDFFERVPARGRQ